MKYEFPWQQDSEFLKCSVFARRKLHFVVQAVGHGAFGKLRDDSQPLPSSGNFSIYVG